MYTVYFSPHPQAFVTFLRSLFNSIFFIAAILAAVQWYVLVPLICLSLVANGNELFFIYVVGMFIALF